MYDVQELKTVFRIGQALLNFFHWPCREKDKDEAINTDPPNTSKFTEICMRKLRINRENRENRLLPYVFHALLWIFNSFMEL